MGEGRTESKPMVKITTIMLIVSSIACSGCLIGMPIEETPVEENLSPQINLSKTEPAIDQLIRFQPGVTQTIEFRTGPIFDPNENDRLFWAWFINYNPNTDQGPAENGPGAGRLQTEFDEDGIKLSVTPCERSNLLNQDTTLHRIELIVTDRPFEGGTNRSLPNARPFQQIADGATSVRLIWFLQFDRNECI